MQWNCILGSKQHNSREQGFLSQYIAPSLLSLLQTLKLDFFFPLTFGAVPPAAYEAEAEARISHELKLKEFFFLTAYFHAEGHRNSCNTEELKLLHH